MQKWLTPRAAFRAGHVLVSTLALVVALLGEPRCAALLLEPAAVLLGPRS